MCTSVEQGIVGATFFSEREEIEDRKDIKCDYQKGTYQSVTHLNVQLSIATAGSACLLVLPTSPVAGNSLLCVSENPRAPDLQIDDFFYFFFKFKGRAN